jgi:predicted nucleic acid-binding protein
MLVVDASVAIKWVVEEEGSADALDLITRPLVAPDLFQAEIGAVLAKKLRQREIGIEQARLGFSEILERVSLLPMIALGARAFELALSLHHSIYDCYYLALAEANGWFLVTADRAFVTKVGTTPHGPFIHLIGEEIADG